MEMESTQPDQDNCLVKETDVEQLVCAAGSLNICGVSGYPSLSPRIGDDYQVKIPPLESQSEAISDASLRFLGLPISIMLIHDKIDSRAEKELRLLGDCGNAKTSTKSGKSKKHNNATEKTGSKLKDEPLDDDRSVHFEKKRKALDKAGSKLKDEPLDDESIHCEKKHKTSEKVGSMIKDDLLDNGPSVPCEKKHNAIKNVGSEQKDVQINDASSAHFEKKHNSIEKVGSKLEDESLDERSVKPQKGNSECGSKTYSFVPGSLGSCWNGDEVESFILGLYIFGKSFVPIKKFVDTKEMGDILSFYYGRFYGSDRYKRWSDCRKVKRRKCVSGDKLFTGWRQQELISRLQPHISESYQKTFQEISEVMAEGKIPLEDYASILKAAVGIHVLVEAIGIGKGKEDLTNPGMESMKTNPATTKSCSSLTPSDIVTLLTGGFRLSKARCTDIFWEAVWPRLLAKGWHSEQPNNLNYLDAKTNLVFLVPGVKKYSRRDLVKGFHYFDSVADVLSRVASEPELLELQGADEENKDDSVVPQSRNYLKPRVSNGNAKSMKFTVVDSSSVSGERGGLVKVKRMRYLPRDLVVTSMVTRISGMKGSLSIEDSKEEEDGDEEKQNLKDYDTMKMVDETKTKVVPNTDKVATSAKFTIVDTSRGKSSSNKIFELRHLPSGDRVTCRWIKLSDENRKIAHDDKVDGDGALHRKNKIHESKELPPQQAKPSSNTVKTSCKEGSNVSNGNQSTKDAAPVQQFSRRPKPGHSNNLVPLVKRRRLTACISTEMSHVTGNCTTVKLGAKEKKICSGLDSSKTVKKNTLKVIVRPQPKLSSSSLAEGCADKECGGGGNVSDMKGDEAEESLPDLNLQPQRQLDSELVGKTESVASESRNLDPGEMPSNNPVSANPESRRQSTRNRPLTTRALEALQYEFLDVRKRPRSSQQEGGSSSSSRRSRSKKIKVASSSKLVVVAEEEKIENSSGGGSSIEEPAAAMHPESCSSR
ncbi:unnamed protein product [Linum tenue]|uniref:SANT domain-containing protein n=2 Tax=Linum tenue TaxID=586396 RepID=A0AAV0R0H7_9ROSI|nr:unnamed protein product [Linum tenue]